jgi:hypothetical protein
MPLVALEALAWNGTVVAALGVGVVAGVPVLVETVGLRAFMVVVAVPAAILLLPTSPVLRAQFA